MRATATTSNPETAVKTKEHMIIHSYLCPLYVTFEYAFSFSQTTIFGELSRGSQHHVLSNTPSTVSPSGLPTDSQLPSYSNVPKHCVPKNVTTLS